MKLDKKELKKFIDFINTVEYSPREFFRYDLVSKYKYIHEDIKPKVNQYRLFFVAQKSISAETLTTDNFFKKIGKLNELCFSESYVNYKTNQPLVDSSFCLYFSINPSDGIKVFNSFVKRMLDEQLRAVTSINKEYSLRLFSNLEKTIKSEAHKAGNRNNKFIDIDIDVNDTYISIVEEIVKEYKENNLKFITIKTYGGYHIVINKSNITYNYSKIIKTTNKELKKINNDFECIINKAAFVPVPGTSRGKKMVTIIDELSNF